MSPDGALVRGLLWLPPDGKMSKTAVILSHPRGDFSVHYACPLLAAAGYATCGFGTRYMGNDTDCLHESCIVDVETVAAEMRRRGAEAVVLLGNSGGGSLMAMANAERGVGDGWVGMAAHPGEGVFMLQVIDPSVGRRGRSVLGGARAGHVRPGQRLASVAGAVHATTATGWPATAPPRWPGSPGSTPSPRDRWPRPRSARGLRSRAVDQAADPAGWRELRARTVFMKYLTIYRTLADPAYLDLTIDPDDRPLGLAVRLPRPARRQLRPRRAGPHHDGPWLAEHLVRAVEPRQAGRHDAGR